MKEGKFVPLYYMEAVLEVKSNLFIGPVHQKAVEEQDWGRVADLWWVMNVGSIEINRLPVCLSSLFPLYTF